MKNDYPTPDYEGRCGNTEFLYCGFMFVLAVFGTIIAVWIALYP